MSSMISRTLGEWRSVPQLTPLLLVLVAVPAVFFTTTAAMVDVWLVNETFTHGFLILPISLWLIWERRRHIGAIAMVPDRRALVFILPALALWTLAALIDVAVVQQLAMVALIPLTVWLLLGLSLTLALLFPLLYLFFLVPLGQSLIPPMMEFTADFSVYLIQATGIPVFRDGLMFELPSGRWSIVEECSGVRYLIASAALGTIYAYLSYQSLTKRALFILASLIVPIFANGLRAYGIVMIGHLSGMKYAVGADHLLYGWVFFGIVIFILFWIGGYWADPAVPATKTEGEPGSGPAMPRSTVVLTVLACLLALNVGVLALKSTGQELPDGTRITLPGQAGAWQRGAARPDRWTPVLNNPDLAAAAEYRRGEESVTLDIGYFHSQRDEAEAVSSLNRLTDPYEGDWNLIAQRASPSPDFAVVESEVSRGGRKVLVWSAFLVGDRYFASATRAKLYQARQLLVGNQRGGFVTLSTPFDADTEAVRTRLADAWPALADHARQAVAGVDRD